MCRLKNLSRGLWAKSLRHLPIPRCCLVPTLTIILSVAAGFGMQASVQRLCTKAFPGSSNGGDDSPTDLVESYLNEIQSSVLIIVGLVVLIYTVFNLILTVESVFNQIWQIKKSRALSKGLIGYFAAIVIVPISLVAISFFNIFIRLVGSIELLGTISIAPLAATLLRVFAVRGDHDTDRCLYALPNTRVKFWPAFISTCFCEVSGFQIFQMVYISGQLWVSKYNSIYGSIAAVPLLMLFMQFSWTIILFGAQAENCDTKCQAVCV